MSYRILSKVVSDRKLFLASDYRFIVLLVGAEIDYALCVIDREEGAVDKLLAEGIVLLSLLKRHDFPT